jgi:hypothetical protein
MEQENMRMTLTADTDTRPPGMPPGELGRITTDVMSAIVNNEGIYLAQTIAGNALRSFQGDVLKTTLMLAAAVADVHFALNPGDRKELP